MDVYKFRKFDIDRVRKLLSDLFEHNLPEGITGKLTTAPLNVNLYKGMDCEHEVTNWQIELTTKTGNSVITFTVPTLVKSNYFLLDGNYYCPPIILELSPLDYNSKSKMYSIYMRPHFRISFNVENDQVQIGYSQMLSLSDFKEILTGKVLNETIMNDFWKAFGIIKTKRQKISLKDFIEKYIHLDYYKKMVRSFITDTDSSEFELIDIINYVIEQPELDYSDLKNRRLVFSDYLFEGVFDLYDTVVKLWINKEKITIQSDKNIVIYKGFALNMKRGGLVDKSIPWSVSINKISQSLKGMGSDNKLKRSWMSASSSQYGIICPISVSAGSMGKVLYLTDSAQINPYGQLTKHKTKTNILSQQNNMVSFMSAVDASRANMAAKQITQIASSRNNQLPYVFNKEHLTSNVYDIQAKRDGIVVYSSENIMIVKYDDGIETETFPIKSYVSIDNVNANILKWVASTGTKFKTNQTLIQYTPGEMKLGYRFKIMWSNFFGYTSDDAFVMSESAAARAFAEYGSTIYIPVTKYSSIDRVLEQGTSSASFEYKTIDKNEKEKTQLFENDGLISKIKFHKIKEPGEMDIICDNFESMIEELKLTQESEFSEIKKMVGNSDAVKIYNEYIAVRSALYSFSQKKLTKFKDQFRLQDVEDIHTIIQIDIIDIIGTGLGDKFTNMYAGKGVVSKIIPTHLMPFNITTGEYPDVVFNPIGLPRRNNLGVVLESLVSNIVVDLQNSINKKELFASKLEYVAEHLIKYNDKEQYDKLMSDADRYRNDTMFADAYYTNINKNGLVLYFDSFEFPRFDYMVSTAKKYCDEFGVDPKRIYKKADYRITKETLDYLDDDGVYDVDFVHEDIEFEALETNNIYLKLSHNSFSKANSVGVNTRVNSATGQALTGRRLGGSSHLSWMTTAGLLGHKQTGGGTIKEALTIMSDASITDKLQSLKEYVIEGETHLKDSYKSTTFNYINQHMKFIGLSMMSEDEVPL